MHNVELSWEAENQIHVERTGCYFVRNERRTTFMFSRNALERVAVTVEENVIASQLLTYLKEKAWESFLFYAGRRLVVDGEDTFDRHFSMCFVKPGFVLVHSAVQLKTMSMREVLATPGWLQ